MDRQVATENSDSCAIAIIGMDGRFPGARNVREFWQNLRSGAESISFFADQELEQPVTPELLRNPNFVKAKGILEDIELFDASFFNISPREAQWMDPQQRLFLECAWSALEDAGYNVTTYQGPIAVYGGANTNSYFLSRLSELFGDPAADSFQIHLANEKDHLATRVSYKLNLRGESITIQTSCSTSLVAVHLACQSLLTGQCDMALAGGVSIRVPQKTGYMYAPGMISSPDGHCRAFDHKAQGTLPGNGVGVVVLKRLSDALADGDNIYAAIKGSAINNDGHLKMGYTAPSIEGQADVIAKALAMAAIDPESLSFVEGHGTGTPIGDPIEVEALTRVFRKYTSRKSFCALGSVKTNIGHLDTAAGVAGLIKTVLAIKHREIPPTLHFDKPNPALDLDNSPFYVNNTLSSCADGPTPLRAAVSSFGLGGTNAHIVLEEVQQSPTGKSLRPLQLVTYSARTPAALKATASVMADFIQNTADFDLADFAFTRNVGRQALIHRRFTVAAEADELSKALRSAKATKLNGDGQSSQSRQIVLLFPGQGSQHVGMARGLYDCEPEFRKHFDDCAETLKRARGLDVADSLYRDLADDSDVLAQPEFALPALFIIEYALSRLWMHWGVKPAGLLGHSYGEFVAAAVAGVFNLDDAVCLASDRGRLMQKLPRGTMLSVRLPAAEVKELLTGALSISSVNSSVSSVISGPCEAIDELERVLAGRKIGSRRLPVPFAYHSPAIDSILPEYGSMIDKLTLRDPSIPVVSNLTGTWIEAGQATNSKYWMDQMRHTVQFATGLETVLNGRAALLLEVGPNQVLTTMARQHLGRNSSTVAFPSLPAQGTVLDHSTLLSTLGSLWVKGFEPDWNNFYAYEQRRRIPTPTYPFERKRYWVDVSFDVAATNGKKTEAARIGPAELDEATAAPAKSNGRYSVQREDLSHAYATPRNAIEERLAVIWGEVLGLESIGIDDNYFELGGDSLLATQMFSRIRETLSADISLETVLFNQTIAELAGEIQKHEHTARPDSLSIRPLDRNGELPLSFAQEWLWLIHQVNPETAAYNLPAAVRLKGALQIQALEKSISEVVRRHEVLRTRFAERDGRATQIVDPAIPIRLPVVELGEIETEQREVEAQRIVTEDARLPFDLERGPLLRSFLLRLGPEDHVIILTVHHIVSDAWSTGIIIQEIATLYEIFRRGEESPLPPLPIQYADYAHWQRTHLQGEKLESLVNYWKQELNGATPVLNLPTDRQRPEVQTLRGAHKSFSLPGELSQSLRLLSRSEGVTLFMTLLAAFQTLLFRYTQQEDFCVGVPVAGRSLKESEGLIGCFINNLVLRARVSREMRFRELLIKTREATLGAFVHQDLPFAKVVEAVQPERSNAHSPLFQVIFDFRSTPREQSQELPELSLSGIGSEMGTAKLDLVLDIWDAGEAIVGSMEYNTDLFDESTIALMLSHFEVLLGSIVQQPDARLRALSIQTESENQDKLMLESEKELSSRKRLLTIKPKPIQFQAKANV